MSKRYFWLKLKEDFFDEKYIKALRRLPQGDSLAIVYLKMQLKSLKTEGIIKYEGILPDSLAELAMALDEDENVVKLAVEALVRFGVVERWDDETLYMSAMQQLIGSESESAARVRKHRALQGNRPALQSNEPVTPCNTEIEKEKELELEKELEKDSEKELEKKKKSATALASDDAVDLESEFEILWKLYPRKEGKSSAQKDYVKARKDKKHPVTMEQVQKGIERYAAYIKKQKTERRFIKQGSTWFHQRCWEDEYLEGGSSNGQDTGNLPNARVGNYV